MRQTPVECAMIKQANWATAAHLATTWMLRLSLAMVRQNDDGGVEDGSWVRLLQRDTFLTQCFATKMSLFVTILRFFQIILLIFTSALVIGLFALREAEERFVIGSTSLFADDAAVGLIMSADALIFFIDAIVLCATTSHVCAAPRKTNNVITRRD